MSITYLPGKEPHPRETRRILKNVNREGWNAIWPTAVMKN